MAFFDGIPCIAYQPDAAIGETLVFRHYNAKQMIQGRTMEDWLRFSVCYWHTFRGTGADVFGGPTISRAWDDGSNSMQNARRRLRVAFEFMRKLGVKYWTFHDRDIAPEGCDLSETNQNLDEISDLALQLMKETEIKLLWATCNLFSHPRYMNGASTNPNAHTFAYAGAQLKKGLEIANKLQAENYVFWGGREGYQSLLNTDVMAELTHMSHFLKMAVNYKKTIGFQGQFLIEPKAKEPTKHQYDYDAMTVIGFLKHFGLEKEFKINVEPNHTTLAGHCYEHDIIFASRFGMLGSIDCNTGSPELGWDTDQFPMDIKNATIVMKTVLEQGGIQPGGLNFDAKLRRESTDVNDMFIAHIAAMDCFARGLMKADQIISDDILANKLKQRYESYTRDIGADISTGECSLQDCESYIMKNGDSDLIQSAEQETYEAILNQYM